MGKIKKYVQGHRNETIVCLIVVILLLCVLIAGLNNTGKSGIAKGDDKKITAITNEGISKNEKYGDLEFSNFTLIKTKENNQFTMSANVKNTSDKSSDIEQVKVEVKDKDGNVLASLLGYIGKEFKSGESRTITMSTSANLEKATSKTISEYKK